MDETEIEDVPLDTPKGTLTPDMRANSVGNDEDSGIVDEEFERAHNIALAVERELQHQQSSPRAGQRYDSKFSPETKFGLLHDMEQAKIVEEIRQSQKQREEELKQQKQHQENLGDLNIFEYVAAKKKMAEEKEEARRAAEEERMEQELENSAKQHWTEKSSAAKPRPARPVSQSSPPSRTAPVEGMPLDEQNIFAYSTAIKEKKQALRQEREQQRREELAQSGVPQPLHQPTRGPAAVRQPSVKIQYTEKKTKAPVPKQEVKKPKSQLTAKAVGPFIVWE